jgi:hypothetical protein
MPDLLIAALIVNLSQTETLELELDCMYEQAHPLDRFVIIKGSLERR